jgi:hypothetical protein
MTSGERNIRKTEVVYVYDGGNRRAVKCDVEEWSVVERFVTVPVHGKYRGVTLQGIQWMVEGQSLWNLHQASCSCGTTDHQENAQMSVNAYAHDIDITSLVENDISAGLGDYYRVRIPK